MFCSECGHSARGKFCSACGHRLQAAVPNDDPIVLQPDFDWRHSLDYERLLREPEVRSRLDQAAARAQQGLTGEEFLEMCENVLSPLTGGVPLTMLAKVAQPLGEKLGLKTSKERRLELAHPPGAAIVALLSYFAEHNYQLTQVEQQSAACILHAAIPSDVWAFKGALTATIGRAAAGASLQAVMTVPGQWYDWGKSQRVIDQLSAAMNSISRAA